MCALLTVTEEAAEEHQDVEHDEEDKPRPDPAFEVGKELPIRLRDSFPKELFGKPIEDLDVFYRDKYVSGRVDIQNVAMRDQI